MRKINYLFFLSFLSCFLALLKIAQADVTIGFMGPLTGPVASYGIQAQNGIKVAVDEINQKGGVLGQKLVVEYLDDAGEPKQAVSVVNQAAGAGIQFLIGPMTGNAALAVSQLLQENGILAITPSCTATQLTQQGAWNMFRTIGRDDQEAIYAAQYVAMHMKGQKIAILHDKGTYGYGLAKAFQQKLNQEGMKEVFFGSINAGEKDYSAVASRLKNLNVDLIYYGGYYTEAGLLLRQLRNVNSHAVLMGADGFNAAELWSIARESAQGTLFTNVVNMRDNPDMAPIFARFQAQNIPADAFTMTSYAAVQILVQAMEKAGTTTDAEAVARVLRDGSAYPSVIGAISYDKNGDIKNNIFSFYQWKDGKIVSVK